MTWATRRKIIYLSIIFVPIFIVTGIVTYFFYYEPPTCFDGKQNQDEDGVDCGGSCVRLCPSQSIEVIMIGNPRVFKVTDGMYSVLAYMRNANINAEAIGVPYEFKLFDAGNVVVAERKGVSFILPNQTFGIFEGNINVPKREPVRATFTFTSEVFWHRTSSSQQDIFVKNKNLVHQDISPQLKLFVDLENKSLKPLSKIEVVAILFDTQDTAIGASRTYIDGIAKEGNVQIPLTWSLAPSAEIAKVEIIPRVLPELFLR